MKLYRTQFKHPGDGLTEEQFLANWSGTQADARKDRVGFKSDGMVEITTDEVEVPTSKADLIAFLNEHKVM